MQQQEQVGGQGDKGRGLRLDGWMDETCVQAGALRNTGAAKSGRPGEAEGVVFMGCGWVRMGPGGRMPAGGWEPGIAFTATAAQKKSRCLPAPAAAAAAAAGAEGLGLQAGDQGIKLT